jgi:hypothetical protein
LRYIFTKPRRLYLLAGGNVAAFYVKIGWITAAICATCFK